MNYCDYLFNSKKEWLDNTALVDMGSAKRYSYRELQEVTRSFGNNLRELGFKPGDIITTHLYNSAEAVIAHLGIQFAGCITCLLDPLTTAEGLTYYLEDTGTKCLLTHFNKENVKAHVPDSVMIFDMSDIENLGTKNEGDQILTEPVQFDKDEVAAIFYTSGTTSRPKGVMLPPRTFHSHFKIFIRSCYTYVPGDSLLCFVPFYHGYGSKSIFIPCIHFGATFVIMRSFHPLKVVETIEKEKITHIFGVPSHFQQLLRREEFFAPMKSLKAAFSAAALLKLETAREWKEKIGFYLDEGYGLIETCTGVAFRKAAMPIKLGHIGTYPKELIDIEIVDDDFNFLPPGERGEIVVHGDSVMNGYLNKPEEIELAIKNGWFRTGDMGFKTPDNEIIMTGRIKD
ncbi:long-chain fatty acid--CoA ligase, partial [candidate division KSB1 bacterium]|nr:long-chain fatty acid--CoA ligase [candidate division KSB1 bacterium]